MLNFFPYNSFCYSLAKVSGQIFFANPKILISSNIIWFDCIWNFLDLIILFSIFVHILIYLCHRGDISQYCRCLKLSKIIFTIIFLFFINKQVSFWRGVCPKYQIFFYYRFITSWRHWISCSYQKCFLMLSTWLYYKILYLKC